MEGSASQSAVVSHSTKKVKETPIYTIQPKHRFRMDDRFIRHYIGKEPAWGPVGKIAYVRTYARELHGPELVEHFMRDFGMDRKQAREAARKTKMRREEFWQTARRVVEFVQTVFKQTAHLGHHPWDEDEAQEKAQEMFKLLWAFKWLPPGRGLQFAGTPVVEIKGGAAMNNCFSGDEKFITTDGVMAFREAEGKTVTVLTRDGWETATVSAFGTQMLQRVTFAPACPNRFGHAGYNGMRSNLRHVVEVTPDHRWLLVEGVETTTLKVGDVIPSVINRDRTDNVSYLDGKRHGLIFGDGTAGYRYVGHDSLREYHIRLCGKKAQVEVLLFDKVSYPPSYGGDPLASLVSINDLKGFPSADAPSDYVRGFLDGWLVADSADSPSGSKRLASQHPHAEAWLRTNAAHAGWLLTGMSTDKALVTNFGRRQHPLKVFTLSRSTDTAWKVTGIEPLDEPADVYCAQVPGARAFALASGVYTGNCGFKSTRNIDKDFADAFCTIMDFLMLGVGMGSDVRGAGKVIIQTPKIIPATYIVEDTREGWVDAVRVKLNGYTGKQTPSTWDFSKVRPEGRPLKTFGGTSSGPGPLIRLLNAIDEILRPFDGLPITATAIADIINQIGCCVVAGNIRRSAEILIGQHGDEEFTGLKDPSLLREYEAGKRTRIEALPEAKRLDSLIKRYRKNQDGHSAASEVFLKNQDLIDRTDRKLKRVLAKDAEWARLDGLVWSHALNTHRWASNNTVLCERDADFEDLAKRIVTNGEPGVAFMDNIRAFGRMNRDTSILPPVGDWLDANVEGFNPCAEQPLEDDELCCLGELNPNAHATLEDFLQTIKYAYMYCKAVTLIPTNRPATNRVMTKNRRIGLSLMGVFKMYERLGLQECIRWWNLGYAEVRKWDRTYSKWLGCNESIKVTSLKPGGTVPLLPGEEGGMKVLTARYYFRTIRADYKSPLVKACRDAGYRVEKDRTSARTMVVYFPVAGESGTRTSDEVPMLEQMQLLAALQGHWSDNMVSNTITFQPHEASHISRAIAAYAHKVKAVSFLPLTLHGYPQAPYIPITKEEYEHARSKLLPLDLSATGHEVDEKYCTGETCSIG